MSTELPLCMPRGCLRRSGLRLHYHEFYAFIACVPGVNARSLEITVQ